MLKKILCGATLLCAAGIANAASISYMEVVDTTQTNYIKTVMLPNFNDMSGALMLEKVTFSIDGELSSAAFIENTGPANTIIIKRKAKLTLTDALDNVLVVTIPTIENTFNALDWDGINDFDGDSGITYPVQIVTQYEESSYTDAATLAYFTGTGNASFEFDAKGTSNTDAGGNVITQFVTMAGGLVKVTYEYSEVPVSAPSQVAFLGLGLLAFAGLRKARK